MTRSTERGTAARAPQDQEREASFFDGLVAECGDFNPFAERGWRTLARKFAACIGEPRKLEILEIGCGTGHSRRLYTQFAKAYVGVDLSRASLRLGRIQHPGDALLCADACRLPLRDASFDVVAFSSLLHHVPDYSLPLLEAYRVLRSDGLAFSFDPNVWHPAMALFRHPRSPLYTAQGVSPNERPLSARAVRHAFRNAGLEVVYLRAQSDIPYRAVAPRRLNSLLSLFNAGDWLWEKLGMGRWFGTFLIACGRKPRDARYDSP